MPFLELAKQFVRGWDLAGTSLRRPGKLVFLCGGRVGEAATPPASGRDVFLRFLADINQLGDARIIRAEVANQMLAESHFEDLLDLEEHVAAVVDGVILFLESAGSICELGAFSRINEIREKLFVFVMSDHANGQSFITQGPLKSLSRRDKSDRQIASYHWVSDTRNASISDYVLPDMLKDSVEHISNRYGVSEKLNIERKGDEIFCVLACVFILRAGLISEIHECMLEIFPLVTRGVIFKALDTLTIAGLLKVVNNGRKQKYYISLTDRINVNVRMKQNVANRDPLRWIHDIVDSIKSEDPKRIEMWKEHRNAF